MFALVFLMILLNLYMIFKPLYKIFKLNYPEITERFFNSDVIEKIEKFPEIKDLRLLNPLNYFNIKESDSKNKIFHKIKLRNSLQEINNNNHYLLSDKDKIFSFLKSYKLIIVHLETVYNYTLQKIKEPYFIKFLKQYCKINDIKLIVYGEISPNVIPEIVSNFNYISPYHYYKSFLGYIYRLKDNGYNEVKINVDIDNVIMDQLDISKFDQSKFLYIANQKSSYKNNICLNNLNINEWNNFIELNNID